MKLGFGFYRHMLQPAYYDFARQCGCTHAVVHLVDYFRQKNSGATGGAGQPVGTRDGWGHAGDPEKLWSVEELLSIKKELNDVGLQWEAIENFDPAHWYDVLLDGPEKRDQIEKLKTIIRNVGKAGIPVFGYNFSLAGVCGRKTGPLARGHAETVYMDEADERPVPDGMVWNMWYKDGAAGKYLPSATHDELWDRVQYFLDEIIPVAEEAGVRMAAHPDDPPVAVMRQTPRLVYKPELYQKLLDMRHSYNNALEFCAGTISEMEGGDIYKALDKYSRQDNIAYIHFRNVRGKAPHYQETFIDEGDIDMLKALSILKDNNFNGVLVPDHTPGMTCDAPWHAGMAYALGFIKAGLKGLGIK